MGTIEHIMDTDEAYAIVNRLLDPLVSGSYLVLYDPTTDGVHGKAMFETCRRRRYPQAVSCSPYRALAEQEAPAVGGNHRGSTVHRNSVRSCYRASRSPSR